MKKYLCILILANLAVSVALAENDSLAVVRAWTLTDDFSSKVPAAIDTNLTNFQVFYPNYIQSKSNTFLGNIGSPSISNIWVDRIYNDDAFFLNPYLPYFHTSENTRYYNTLKPYSRLSYTSGGDRKTREESFEAFITENLGPKFNFALRYHNIASKGQYKYQQVKKNAFRGSVNYTTPRYIMHGSFNVNRHKANENGGIDDAIFESGEYDFNNTIPTRITGGGGPNFDSDAQNIIYHYDYMVSQRLKLFTLASKIDTTQPSRKRNVAEPILTYVVRAGRGAKTYNHLNPAASGLYDHYYFNYGKTSDSVANFRLTNTAKLEFKTVFRGKVQLGVFGLIGNEFDRYAYNSLWDTSYTSADTTLTLFIPEEGDTLKGVNLREDISSTFFSTGFYGSFWNKVSTSFTGKVYFLGYKSGQTEFKGLLDTYVTIFKRGFLFDAAVEFKNKVPSYLLQNYYSNHYIWTKEQQNLNTEIWTSLSGKISAPSNNFELTGNYYLISGLIYFDQDGIPANYGNPVNVLSLGVAKTFKLWKLNSINKIIYQVSENSEVLAIPDLVFYNSTYLNHIFRFNSTGGELESMLGFEIYYTTGFYGYEYSPALSQFYTQENEIIGAYPLMDAFLNLKLKRTRFFVKLQHFNSEWFTQNYYAAVHYPHIQVMNSTNLVVKFGLSWVFYD